MEKPTTDERPIFRNLDGDDPDPETTVIKSLCMNCYKEVKNLLCFRYSILRLSRKICSEL